MCPTFGRRRRPGGDGRAAQPRQHLRSCSIGKGHRLHAQRSGVQCRKVTACWTIFWMFSNRLNQSSSRSVSSAFVTFLYSQPKTKMRRMNERTTFAAHAHLRNRQAIRRCVPGARARARSSKQSFEQVASGKGEQALAGSARVSERIHVSTGTNRCPHTLAGHGVASLVGPRDEEPRRPQRAGGAEEFRFERVVNGCVFCSPFCGGPVYRVRHRAGPSRASKGLSLEAQHSEEPK
jgi:hypothetical protein